MNFLHRGWNGIIVGIALTALSVSWNYRHLPHTLSVLLSDWITYEQATPFIFNCKECYRLTEALNWRRGCIWDPDMVDLSGPVFMQATMYFGDNEGGADGICLVIAASPGCGDGGGYVGAGGIPNSVIIEFDTWDNGPAFGDIPDDHVALNINGDMTTPLFGPVSLGNIEDGLEHSMSFSYDGAGNFEVVFDGATVLTGNLDFAAVIGSSNAFIGFTSSTGGANNLHIVCPDNIPVPPADVPDWASYVLEVCEGATAVPYGVVPEEGHTYAWTIPPGVSGSTSGASVALTWGDTGGEVCVRADNGCGESDTVCVEVIVIPIPKVSVEPVILCDDAFNLDELELMNLQPGETLTFHPTQQAAQAGFPDMLSPPIVYFSGRYWLRIEAGDGCVQVLPVDVTLEDLEIIVDQPAPVCAPQTIDLTLIPIIDVNGLPIVFTSFHLTAAEAVQSVNPLLQTNIASSGTYWVRAESEHGCWDVAPIEIIIQEPPIGLVEAPPAICDTIGFDLSSMTILELSGLDTSAYAISYHSTIQAAQQGTPTLSPPLVNTSGTYWIRMTTAAGCYEIVPVEVIFVETASAFLLGPDSLCAGEILQFSILFTGSGSYAATYTYLGDTLAVSGQQNPLVVELPIPGSGWIELLGFEDTTPEGCPQEIGPAIYVEVLPEFRISAPVMICDGQQFTVQFQLLEGDTASWMINGLGGTAQGGVFLSEPLPSGTTWSALTWDGNGCDTLELSGAIHCDCGNDAGVIPSDTLVLCPGDTVSFVHTGLVLGPNDTLIWSIHSSGAQVPFTQYTFPTNAIYYPGVNKGILPGYFYRVVGMVGQKDEQSPLGIDLNDPCFKSTNFYYVFFEWSDEIQQITAVPGTEFTCLDTVITLNVLYNPGLYWGAPPSYLWQTQGGQILTDPAATTVQVRGAGTYFFQVQSVLSSCMDTASITLTVSEDVPEVVIQMPETLTCVTTSVQLDASGSSQGTDFAYQWSTQDGQVVTGGSTLTPTVSQPGTYLLTIADNINQCSSTGTVTVLQNVTPPLADAGPDITLDCGEDYPLLDGGASMGQGPLTYAWSTPDGLIVGPANQALLSINRPGKYVLQVTDTTNGCQDSTVVEVHLTDGLVVSGVFVHDLLCHGDQHGEVGIAGVSGGTPPYTMQVGSVAQPAPGSMTGLAEGAYLLRVFDAGGCIWDSLINLWAPPPIQINLGPDVELQMGASHVFVPAVSGGTPPYGFTWFQGGDEVCTVCPSYTASPITDTEVMLYLIDANGCVALATVRMRVFSVKSVYIPNSFSPNYDGINDLFVVYGGDVVRRVRRLAVFDRWGNALYDVADLPADGTAGWDGHYRGQLMDPGVYVYAAEIEFEDGVIRLYKGDVTLLR